MSKFLGMKKNNIRGITAVEITVALLVVAVITTIGIISYSTYVEKSEVLKLQNFLTNVASKLGNYYQDNREYTDDLAELGIDEIPVDIRNSTQLVKIAVNNNTDNNGFTFLATLVPNPQRSVLKDAYPLVIDNEENRFYSTNVLCQSITDNDDDETVYKYCSQQDIDPLWGGKFKSDVSYTFDNLQKGRIKTPIEMSGVDNNCAYAIAVRNQEIFNRLECGDEYAWPYKSGDSPPIRDNCLEAFNNQDKVAFTLNNCCSDSEWIIKSGGSCTKTKGVQPPKNIQEAYNSPETAGQIKIGHGCLQASWGAIVHNCDGASNGQKWYYDSVNKLWRNKANNNRCLHYQSAGAWYHRVLKVLSCNANSENQNSITYDESVGGLRYKDNKCFYRTWWWQRKYLRLAGCAKDYVSSVDTATAEAAVDAAFSSQPECRTHYDRKDAHSYYHSGCCSLYDYPHADFSCNSPQLIIANYVDNATRLEFKEGYCLRPQTRGKITAGVNIAQWKCSYGSSEQSNKWFTDSQGRLRLASNPDLCLQAAIRAGIRSGKLTLQNCSSRNSQKFKTVGGQLRTHNNLCITSPHYRKGVNSSLGPYHCNGMRTVNLATRKITDKFSAKPACSSAVDKGDFNSFTNNGCCQIGEWHYSNRVKCSSNPPIQLPSTPTTAKKIELNPGYCLITRTDDRVAQHPCNSKEKNKKWAADDKWYIDSNGLMRNPENPNKCLQAVNALNHIKKGSLKMVTCDPNNILQQFSTHGGQLRSKKHNNCITVPSYTRRGNLWAGVDTCNGKHTPNINLLD